MGSGGKKTFKRYFKSGHTDRQTHIHIHKVNKAGFGADWGNSRPQFERIEICSAKYIFSPTRPSGQKKRGRKTKKTKKEEEKNR